MMWCDPVTVSSNEFQEFGEKIYFFLYTSKEGWDFFNERSHWNNWIHRNNILISCFDFYTEFSWFYGEIYNDVAARLFLGVIYYTGN